MAVIASDLNFWPLTFLPGDLFKHGLEPSISVSVTLLCNCIQTENLFSKLLRKHLMLNYFQISPFISNIVEQYFTKERAYQLSWFCNNPLNLFLSSFAKIPPVLLQSFLVMNDAQLILTYFDKIDSYFDKIDSYFDKIDFTYFSFRYLMLHLRGCNTFPWWLSINFGISLVSIHKSSWAYFSSNIFTIRIYYRHDWRLWTGFPKGWYKPIRILWTLKLGSWVALPKGVQVETLLS